MDVSNIISSISSGILYVIKKVRKVKMREKSIFFNEF